MKTLEPIIYEIALWCPLEMHGPVWPPRVTHRVATLSQVVCRYG